MVYYIRIIVQPIDEFGFRPIVSWIIPIVQCIYMNERRLWKTYRSIAPISVPFFDLVLVVATPGGPAEIFANHQRFGYECRTFICYRFLYEIGYLCRRIYRRPSDIDLCKQVHFASARTIVWLTVYAITVVIESTIEAGIIHIRWDVWWSTFVTC